MKPGDLVKLHDHYSSAKMFIEPYSKWRSVIREEVGVFKGIGVVLDVLEGDVMILTSTCVGWCYMGNVEVISETR